MDKKEIKRKVCGEIDKIGESDLARVKLQITYGCNNWIDTYVYTHKPSPENTPEPEPKKATDLSVYDIREMIKELVKQQLEEAAKCPLL